MAAEAGVLDRAGAGSARWARARATLGAYTCANPIVALEFRRVLRGRLPVYFVIFFLLAMGGFSVLSQVEDSMHLLRSLLGIRPGGGGNSPANAGIIQFSAICISQFYMLVAIMPGLFAAAIPREREQHVFSAIRASLLTPGQIISGRLFAAGAVALLLLALGAPFMAVGFLTGGISAGQLLAILGALLIVAAFFAAFSLAVGSEFRGSTAALLISYLFCGFFVFPLLFMPGRVMQSILSTDAASVIGGAALIYLLPAALFIAIARERLAGWHERGSVLRLVLLLATLCYPAAICALATDFFTSSFSTSDLRGSFLASGVIFFAAMTLLCGRAPHPEQVRLPFFTALRQATSPRALWREDPLGMPAFVLIMFFLNLLIHGGLAVAIGAHDLIIAMLLLWSAMLTGMLAYSGLGLLLAFLLRTPRFVSAAVGANALINLALIFVAFILDKSYHYNSLWLSAPAFFIEYAEKINRAIFSMAQGDLPGDFSVTVMVHIVIAYFAWRGLYTVWQRQHLARTYALRDESAHD